MAVVKGSVIGYLSGKLGLLSARTIKGRTILAARPTNFNVSYVPALVEIRKKFAVTGKFVRNLLNLSALYQIWTRVKEKDLSVFNTTFKKNFSLSSADKPTKDNIITPSEGFALPVTTATVGEDKVTLVLAALNTAVIIDEQIERNYVINGMLCYYNPVNAEDEPFALLGLVKAPAVVDTTHPLTIEIPLNVVQQAIMEKYQSSILYVALATLDAGNKVVQYSSTFNQEQ
jgi:hypothetical protein